MKYVLIGYKTDELGTVYESDLLEYSDREIVVNDELKHYYWPYDILKVYKEAE